jgi:hypothetical protein
MKIAVVGSRGFNDYDYIANILNNIEDITLIISGGAPGADRLAELYADKNNINKLILKADWDKYGKSAGIIRNKDIVDNAEYIIAFWDGVSKGTKNSIDRAKKANKKVLIFKV